MFDFENLSASKLYVAPSVERVVEFSPPGIDMQNVAKVLSLAVDARSTSVEASDGYAQVTGRTNFRLTYLDREGTPKGVDYNADFTVKADGDFVATDTVGADIRIVESDVQAGDRLTLSAVLEVCVSAVRREEITVLTGADGCYKTTKKTYLPSFIASKTFSSPFDDEKEVGGEIESVLSMNNSVAVKRSTATQGGAMISATVYSVVTYLAGGEIKQANFAVDLEEEIALDGAEEHDAISVSATVRNAKIVLQGVTDDNVIRVEGEVQFFVRAFRCAEIDVIDDVFTLTNEVRVTRESSQYVCFDGCGYFSQHVSGTAMLGDNRAAATEVNALPYASCYTSKAYVDEDGKLAVEGLVNTDIIYTDENGYNSVRTEIPFSLAIDSEKPLSKTVSVKCVVESISAKVSREREFEIEMKLGIEACGYSDIETSYISAVEVGEEKPQNTSGLSMYIARGGDDMLDLCKAFTAMPDDILKQNPTLEFPLDEGERVIYFRQISM